MIKKLIISNTDSPVTLIRTSLHANYWIYTSGTVAANEFLPPPPNKQPFPSLEKALYTPLTRVRQSRIKGHLFIDQYLQTN